MPIYDQEVNAETRMGEHRPIQYLDNGDSASVRVVHLGIGDVMVETGAHGEVSDVLMFRQGETHPIGHPTPDEIGKTIQPPVELYFERSDSIDVVIDQLQKLKNEMLAKNSEIVGKD